MARTTYGATTLPCFPNSKIAPMMISGFSAGAIMSDLLGVLRGSQLAAILAHNRDEETEHAAMSLEWMRRQDPVLDEHLRTYLFSSGSIVALEEEAEGGRGKGDDEAVGGVGEERAFLPDRAVVLEGRHEEPGRRHGERIDPGLQGHHQCPQDREDEDEGDERHDAADQAEARLAEYDHVYEN